MEPNAIVCEIRVHVADDNEDMREIIGTMLTRKRVSMRVRKEWRRPCKAYGDAVLPKL